VDQEPGRDPYGLVHSFLWAGTSRVVASSWNVNSVKAARFMEKFYTSYYANARAEQASRTALQAIFEDPESRHPYYWAAFQVFGRPF
jgi:CHAT domain-containing protein